MTKARILADLGSVPATLTATELGYSDGVTSAVQTQLTAKAPTVSPTFTGTTTVSGDLVPATPLSHRNMIINGDMQVWQRSVDTTASDGSNEGYNSIDRWFFDFNSSCPGTLDIDRFADAPNGFSYSMRLKCNATGTPASSSTDYVLASTTLEAQDLQRLCYGTADAKVTTLSWYMKSVNFTTPIGIFLETFDGTKEYYHVNVTPTTSWARYSVTIPKSTSATITNDNGSGLLIGFILSGSTDGSFAETNDSSAWSTTKKVYRTNQTNFFSNTSNEFYIAGLQFELGSNATPFEHRSYGDEFVKCQRYYQKVGKGTSGCVGSGSTAAWGNAIPLTVNLRDTPEMTPTANWYHITGSSYTNTDAGNAVISNLTDAGGGLIQFGTSNLTSSSYQDNYIGLLYWNGIIYFDAEL